MSFAAQTRRNPRTIALAGGALILVSLGLLTVQRQSPGFDSARDLAAGIFTPFISLGTAINNGAADAWGGFFQSKRIRDENEALKAELAEMRIQSALSNHRIAEFDQEVLLSEELPDYAPMARTAPVIAPVIDGRKRRLWIGLGSRDGIEEGQTVIGPNGVLGRVRETHSRHAIVELLTDEESKWGGEVAACGETGVVRGTGDSAELEFRLERTTTQLQAGDEIMTSGMKGSLIPAGLPLGRVKSISVDESGERHAMLEAAQVTENLRNVYVLTAEQLPWEPPTE